MNMIDAGESPVAELDDVSVIHETDQGPVTALDGVSFTCNAGTSSAIIGRSGSGKSTLISSLSLLRKPTNGGVRILGQDVTKLTELQFAKVRQQRIGIVFQNFHLDYAQTVEYNVMLPWYFGSELNAKGARARTQALLEELHIAELAKRRPHAISGGQRQRVAIARALFTQPALLVADEPTGNLDEDSAGLVSNLLFDLPQRSGTAVVVVTHDSTVAARAQRKFELIRGRIHDAT